MSGDDKNTSSGKEAEPFTHDNDAYVSQIYQASATEGPSAKLDASILLAAIETAKQAVKNTDVKEDKSKVISSRPLWYKWQYSGSIAASILLVVFFISQGTYIGQSDEASLSAPANEPVIAGQTHSVEVNEQSVSSQAVSSQVSARQSITSESISREVRLREKEQLGTLADSVDSSFALSTSSKLSESDLETEEEIATEAGAAMETIIVSGARLSLTESHSADSLEVDALYAKADVLLADLLAWRKLALRNVTLRNVKSLLQDNTQSELEESTDTITSKEEFLAKQAELHETLTKIRAIEAELWELDEDYSKVLTEEQIETLEALR